MISVVTVYHDRATLERVLLPSLRKQTAPYEWIPMDNTEGVWGSAAAALNEGGRKAHGDYIMFIHQDVELASPKWLANVECLLGKIPDLGVAGVIGMSPEGNSYQERLRGFICNAGQDWGNPPSVPQRVQTLDECVLIMPRWLFQSTLPFDEDTFDGWHCYGCDYALTINEWGMGAYAVPGYVYHRSRATNIKDLRKYHIRLFLKHCWHYSRIYATTNGLTATSILAVPAIEIFTKLNQRIFPSWVEMAKREVRDCKSLLDLGCGYNSPVQDFGVPTTVGVEIHEPYLVESQMKALHTGYIQDDIRTLDLPERSFEAIFCSEVLEHMVRPDGEALLERMEGWASKTIIITCPNGWVYQDGYDSNPYQRHRSAWSPRDLRERGYRVYGMSGTKLIRGYKGALTLRPEFLGMRLAGLSHKVTKHVPEWDFQMLAIKDLRRGHA